FKIKVNGTYAGDRSEKSEGDQYYRHKYSGFGFWQKAKLYQFFSNALN
ncbi:MAG: hypothetical protein ACI89U_002993, partial [Gammaproteobacteria bacterium]